MGPIHEPAYPLLIGGGSPGVSEPDITSAQCSLRYVTVRRTQWAGPAVDRCLRWADAGPAGAPGTASASPESLSAANWRPISGTQRLLRSACRGRRGGRAGRHQGRRAARAIAHQSAAASARHTPTAGPPPEGSGRMASTRAPSARVSVSSARPARPPDARRKCTQAARAPQGGLALEVDELLEDLVGGGDHARVRLESALSHDQVGELGGEVHV